MNFVREQFSSLQLGFNPSDRNPIELQAPMTRSRPIYGTWPRHNSSILDENIGYLRIERMDGRLLPHIRASMEAFRNTQGLIIDLRGNGGGSRELLIAIAGYLKAPMAACMTGVASRSTSK